MKISAQSAVVSFIATPIAVALLPFAIVGKLAKECAVAHEKTLPICKVKPFSGVAFAIVKGGELHHGDYGFHATAENLQDAKWVVMGDTMPVSEIIDVHGLAMRAIGAVAVTPTSIPSKGQVEEGDIFVFINCKPRGEYCSPNNQETMSPATPSELMSRWFPAEAAATTDVKPKKAKQP